MPKVLKNVRGGLLLWGNQGPWESGDISRDYRVNCQRKVVNISRRHLTQHGEHNWEIELYSGHMYMINGENIHALEQVFVRHSMTSNTFVVGDAVVAPLRHQNVL